LYYPLLRRVPVTHVAYFSVIPTTGTRYAPSGLRNRSDRRPSTLVYRKFIRSHRHSTTCRFEGDRQPPASASSRRSQMKVTRYRVNNASTCATNGAPAEIRLRKAAEQKERRHKRFFHRGAAGAALVKMSLHIRVPRNFWPQYVMRASSRVTDESPRDIKRASSLDSPSRFSFFDIIPSRRHLFCVTMTDLCISCSIADRYGNRLDSQGVAIRMSPP